MSMNSITITNYKPYQKGALAAFFSVTMPSGLVAHECKLFTKDGRRWIGLPSREFVGRDGNKSYKPILEFTNREACEKFRDVVLDAIDGMSGAQKQATRPASQSSVSRAQIPADDSDIPF